MSKTINENVFHEPARSVPVLADVDVLVCGGGPAGVGAALAAARAGVRTLLIEKGMCLGGMGTAGMVNRLGPYHDQEKIILKGLPWEILRTLIDRGLAQEPIITTPENWMDYWLVFDPEGMKLVLDEYLSHAGAEVLFDCLVTAPIMDGSTLCGVIIESKSGRQAIRAKMIIDATGDGDVAARAGVPFSKGREQDGLMQPMTIFFKCLNMDWPKTWDYVCHHEDELVARAKKETGNDFILPGTDSYLHPEETYFNCLHEFGVDGTDVRDISRAAISLRQKMWRNTEVLRRHVPGCERVSVSASASTMGVRETRRFQCGYELTIDDVLSAKRFDDEVYQYACFVDIHEPAPGDTSEFSNENLKPGQSYGVPFRCLLPNDVENLLLAGRCLGASHEALASVRMMPSCMAMGQAAGTAASICLQTGQPLRTLDIGVLRAQLAADGVLLD